MQLGIGVSEDLPVQVQQLLATHVESAGFRSLWVSEARGRDALLVCQARAAATTTLQVGVGVIPVWTRSPAQLAMASATLQEATGGRFLLGLGVSHAAMGRWHGARVGKPLTAARELLRILAQVEAGDTTDVDGEVMRSQGFQLGVDPLPPPAPKYLAAMGPRMLELGATHADGVLLNWSGPQEVLRAGRLVAEAAQRAGRDPDDVQVATYLRMAVADDRDAARAALAEQIATYAAMPAYASHLERQGFGDAIRRVQTARDRGAHGEALAEALGADALNGLGWAGTPQDDPSDMLDAYRQAGLDHLIARVVVVGDDAVASIHAVIGRLDPFTGT